MKKKDLLLLFGILLLLAFSLKPGLPLADEALILKLDPTAGIPPGDDEGTGFIRHKFFLPAKAYTLDAVELATRYELQNEVLARYQQ